MVFWLFHRARFLKTEKQLYKNMQKNPFLEIPYCDENCNPSGVVNAILTILRADETIKIETPEKNEFPEK